MSKGTGKTLCQDIINAIKTDADLLSFCNAKFGKAPNFLIGFDPKSPPSMANTPLIVLVPSGWRDEHKGIRNHTILLSTIIKSDAATTADGVTIHGGIEISEELEDIVFGLIKDFVKGLQAADDQRGYSILEPGPVSSEPEYPEFYTGRNITISALK